MGCPMGYHSMPELEAVPIFDHMSVAGLVTVGSILATAYSASFAVLHASPPTRTRVLFTWHLFDALVHFTLGAVFLYNVCFTSMSTLDIAYTRGMHSQAMTPPGRAFLGDAGSLHGSFYGRSTAARLWQEYAKADKRWGGSDLTISSVEILTVFVIAPLSLHVCRLLREREDKRARYWMMIVAIGQLYGGLMVVLPEWLTGSPNLDTSNFLTFWVYLVFFRSVWTIFPLWVLWEAYGGLASSDRHLVADSRKK